MSDHLSFSFPLFLSISLSLSLAGMRAAPSAVAWVMAQTISAPRSSTLAPRSTLCPPRPLAPAETPLSWWVIFGVIYLQKKRTLFLLECLFWFSWYSVTQLQCVVSKESYSRFMDYFQGQPNTCVQCEGCVQYQCSVCVCVQYQTFNTRSVTPRPNMARDYK